MEGWLTDRFQMDEHEGVRILDFDYQDRLAFPAGKEFRFFDLRSLINRSERIQDMTQTAYQTDVYLVPDRGRAFNAYLFNPDANGKFVIQNFDIGDQADIYADYANIHFTFENQIIGRRPLEGKDRIPVATLPLGQPNPAACEVDDGSVAGTGLETDRPT